ncbi:MAG TPA: hypothetical protein VJC21_04385 [Candidatus Nanoarchaeia archaeon]|nr:hypothetical protein [Candidatus Nanoarchaeia archaeon]
MYHTKRIDEEFAFDEPDLEKFVLRKVSSLCQDGQEVGKVLQVAYNHQYTSSDYELQAEFYPQPLPADNFFAAGLVHRQHAYEPLQADGSLEGIVLSKGSTGVIYPKKKNCLFLRPAWFAVVLGILAEHAEQRETFAGYRASGHSWCGFLGYYYQPPGPDQEKRKFLEKGKETDSISTVVQAKIGKESAGKEVYEYWNSEKVSVTKPLGETGIEATLWRDDLRFKRGEESFHLWRHQIPALQKLVQLYIEEKA